LGPHHDKLASLGNPHGYATPTAIRASAESYKLVEHSPKAVALAFRRLAGNNRPNLICRTSTVALSQSRMRALEGQHLRFGLIPKDKVSEQA
jgi:hypothetical protein